MGVGVADVGGVHAEVGGDEGEREEDDGDDGEDEDGGFLAVLVRFDTSEVLVGWRGSARLVMKKRQFGPTS